MRTVLHGDPAAFSSLVTRWHDLLAKDPTATVFHTPQYLATWWTEFGMDRDLRIVEVLEEDTVRGIAALVASADEVLRFAGDIDTTDYQGPISAPEDREAVAAAILEASGSERWREFHMDGFAADSGWPEAFTSAAHTAGFGVEEQHSEVCPRISLPSGFDAYLAALPGKLRHEVLRKERRLEREAGPYTIRLATEQTLDDDLEKFFEMHRSSDGPKGRFMHEGMASFFGSFAWMLFSQGWLRLALLEIDGEAWAGTYGYSYGGVWGLWNSAFDHRRKELSPGMVLVSECIRLAAAEGCSTFDFLRGREPYKYRFGTIDVPLIRLVIRPE